MIRNFSAGHPSPALIMESTEIGSNQLNTPEKPSLNIKTEFRWHAKPDTWAGMTRPELVDLTHKIAGMIKITPEQASKIQVVFGDDVSVNTKKGQESMHIGVCLSEETEEGIVTGNIVVINRSREVAEYVASPTMDEKKESESHFSSLAKNDGTAQLDAVLSPREWIEWILTEELHHSKAIQQLISSQRRKEVGDKYISILEKKSLKYRNTYSLDIIELAASRVCVLTLMRLAKEQGNSQRAAYFRALYQESLKNGAHIMPNIDLDDVSIPTGWSPKNLQSSRFEKTRDLIKRFIRRNK